VLQQASPTWEGAAPIRPAISRTTGCSVTFGMPGNAEPSGKNGL